MVIFQNRIHILIIFLISIWFSFEFIILGPYSYVTMFDMGDLHIPLNYSVKLDIQEFGISYWNKNHKSGTDLISEGYLWSNIVASCIQYIIVSPWIAYSITKFLSFFISLFFTYQICKNYLLLSNYQSIIAGILFSLIAGNYDAEGLSSKFFFPLVLYLLVYFSNKSNKNYFFLFTAIPLGIIYGSASFFVWDFASILFLFLFLIYFSRIKIISLIYFSIFLISLLIYQSQLIFPILYNAVDSHRFQGTFDIGSRYSQIIREIFLLHHKNNQYYIFIFNIIFFTISFYTFRFKNKKLNFLFFLLTLNLFMGLIFPIVQILVVNFLPHINGIEAGRIFRTTFHFFLIIIAVYSFNNFSNRFKLFLLILVLSFSILPKFDHLKLYLFKGHSFNNIFNSKILKDLKKENIDNFRVATLTNDTINSTISANVLMFYGFEEATGYSSMHSKKYDNFWKLLSNTNGNRLLLNRKYETKSIKFEELNNLSLLSLANVKYIISDYNLISKNLKLLHRPNINLQYNSKRIRELSFRELIYKIKYIHSGENFYIYENKLVLPRFYIVNDYVLFENIDKLNEKLSLSNVNTLKNKLFITSEYAHLLPKDNKSTNYKNIHLVKYSPDLIELEVDIDRSSVMVFTNSFSKFWNVYVDGQPKKIIPSYGTFWGVVLGSKSKSIIFKYEPPYKFF